MKARFSADCNLGKLSKWLRILGYDTLYERGNADRGFLLKAWEEGRTALTRKRNLARLSLPGLLVVVKADDVARQIGEVLEALTLDPDPANRMTRCLHCNMPLEEVRKKTIEDIVPSYVYGTTTRFRQCSLCGRIFWPGTHLEHVEEYLRTRIPFP